MEGASYAKLRRKFDAMQAQRVADFVAQASKAIDLTSPHAMPIILKAFKAAEGR